MQSLRTIAARAAETTHHKRVPAEMQLGVEFPKNAMAGCWPRTVKRKRAGHGVQKQSVRTSGGKQSQVREEGGYLPWFIDTVVLNTEKNWEEHLYF